MGRGEVIHMEPHILLQAVLDEVFIWRGEERREDVSSGSGRGSGSGC
jgi:hypothetical protein